MARVEARPFAGRLAARGCLRRDYVRAIERGEIAPTHRVQLRRGFHAATRGTTMAMASIASLPVAPAYRPRNDALSSAGRAVHDVGAAALFGGNLFARVAMHPALASVCAPRERGIVTNRAWRRYGVVNGISLIAVLAGWGAARRQEAREGMLDPVERGLAHARDAAVVAVAVTGLASAVEGIRFARAEPEGAVPLADGDTPAPEATPREARMKRVLSVVGAVNLVAEVSLVAINATLAQRTRRRPPVRRLLAR